MLKFLKILNSYRIRILSDIKHTRKAVEWRLKNKHNKTIISKSVKNSSIISVGKYSYGILDVLSFENPNEKLIIGDFVSIAGNVLFILGGNHQINAFSTYPLKAHFFSKFASEDAQTKGLIVVEDEVWIGNNVIIMSGVKLGRGCIIAAGSVVTKDVEPFTISGGNPAKFIKFRIPKELIERRMGLDINNFSFEAMNKESLDLFYQPLNDSILNQLTKIKEV
ncbi:CatB-related O-acetyltransferase [Pedobacter sp. 22226]|uniref:CatB-related O-acetyltransferase n=1 Tax=Pedobacter sp. 22226 TaxID=3453894 RepID=UPI003F87487D